MSLFFQKNILIYKKEMWIYEKLQTIYITVFEFWFQIITSFSYLSISVFSYKLYIITWHDTSKPQDKRISQDNIWLRQWSQLFVWMKLAVPAFIVGLQESDERFDPR